MILLSCLTFLSTENCSPEPKAYSGLHFEVSTIFCSTLSIRMYPSESLPVPLWSPLSVLEGLFLSRGPWNDFLKTNWLWYKRAGRQHSSSLHHEFEWMCYCNRSLYKKRWSKTINHKAATQKPLCGSCVFWQALIMLPLVWSPLFVWGADLGSFVLCSFCHRNYASWDLFNKNRHDSQSIYQTLRVQLQGNSTVWVTCR